MKISLSKFDYLHVLALIVINILLTDLISSNVIKSVLSVLPFFVLLFTYFLKSKKRFYEFFLIYLFAFPFAPRNIILVQKGMSDDTFISFINFNVGFLSLSLLAIIFFTILEVKKLGYLIQMIKYFLLFIMTLMCYSIISNSGDFYLNFFISDLKPFLIFFFGFFSGLCIWKRYNVEWNQMFFKIVYILLLIYFTKTIFYILYDSFTNVYNTSFSTLPYFFIPVLFLAFFQKKMMKRNFIMLAAIISSFSLSRGYFIMIGVLYLILPVFFTNFTNLKKVFASYILFSFLGFLILSFSHLFLSEKINVFLQYKLNFFTSEIFKENVELNRSTLIRVYEFKNIMYDSLVSPIYLFLGKGLGGYFEFRQYQLPTYLGVDAFSHKQLELNKFFRPHTFFNVALLKGGLLLLILYSKKCISIFLYSRKVFKRNKKDIFIVFAGIFSLLFFFFFWIPEFLFLDGLILGYVKCHRKNNFL
ncbi:membrane hypothetical protein [Tenacibaculum sp. 190524A02b]